MQSERQHMFESSRVMNEKRGYNFLKDSTDNKGECINIIIGCTGSVASIKIPKIVEELQLKFKHKDKSLKMKDQEKMLKICVITTERAKHFFDERMLDVPVFQDQDEWQEWSNIGDPVLHIELRRWADMMVIAPLDANTLAKISNGLCDNLLTCVVRAWDMQRPLLFAPAMNTHMLSHPLTGCQIELLRGFGYTEVPCVEKTLACGDTGRGAMAEVATIVSAVMSALGSLPDKSQT